MVTRAHIRSMAERLPSGRFHLCGNGSHMAMYDDQASYFDALVRFVSDHA